MITVLGPTACGKTRFAVSLAHSLDGEILSGDSRQVYRGMDIGTGKDLSDYTFDGQTIPYHLIDIADPGTKYNVYQFQRDFAIAYNDISKRGKLPILCGGTGLYIESVLRDYRMSFVPENKELRTSLSGKSLDELTSILKSYKVLHNTTDVDSCQRAIRAIEIEEYYDKHPDATDDPDPQTELFRKVYEDISRHSIIIGLNIPRDLRRERISQRLKSRLSEGMVDEIKALIDSGIAPDDLIYYGLEYKYVTLYVIGQLSYDEMYSQLEIAIHQFAKRQMTWFRGMERRGLTIHWIDATDDISSNIDLVKQLYNK